MMRIASASLTRWAMLAPRRRRVTREEIKGSSGWGLASETRYVYDGMQVIQERNGNGVPTVAYTRGPDLSGTLEGAGGIGGLLARSEWDGSAWSRHAFYHSDGVGNVTALAVPNGNDIALAGSYRYDPFGRLIGTPTGLAAINTQRYSSKDWHNPSGFYYFGYRFYDPATQRWLNRDPIEEEGGINLYAYVFNDPVNEIDPFGLAVGDWYDPRTYWNEGFLEGWSKSGQGVINAFTGGLFWPEYGLFYDTFDKQWKDLDTEGTKDDSAFKFGNNCGRVAVGSLAGAGAAQAAGFNPWLGTIARHGAHASGPHQYPHLQIMLRTGAHRTSHLRIPLGK